MPGMPWIRGSCNLWIHGTWWDLMGSYIPGSCLSIDGPFNQAEAGRGSGQACQFSTMVNKNPKCTKMLHAFSLLSATWELPRKLSTWQAFRLQARHGRLVALAESDIALSQTCIWMVLPRPNPGSSPLLTRTQHVILKLCRAASEPAPHWRNQSYSTGLDNPFLCHVSVQLISRFWICFSAYRTGPRWDNAWCTEPFITEGQCTLGSSGGESQNKLEFRNHKFNKTHLNTRSQAETLVDSRWNLPWSVRHTARFELQDEARAYERK